ncbi:hypothetical protein DJ71_06610 [Halorubrum sp. E3]|nr:hypothetical protein DJ71_06610 [Halorubrum sp. E3]
MTVEVVKSDALGKENVDRHTDVRSVHLPSTRGMVRLDDVVELLEGDDDVPLHAIGRLKEDIDNDPSTGGHIGINSVDGSAHTALFERVDIYAAKVDNARGSVTCGPDESWLHVVIPDELDSRMFEAVNYEGHALPDDVYNRSTLVEAAVEQLLDDSDAVEGATDNELIAELEQRGFDVIDAEPEKPVAAGIR